MIRYYALVLHAALMNTAMFIGWGSGRVYLQAALLLILGFGIHYVREGREEVLSEWSLLLSFTVLPFLVVLVSSYLWNLFRAPFNLSREAVAAAEARELEAASAAEAREQEAASAASIRENELSQTISGQRGQIEELEARIEELEARRNDVIVEPLDGDGWARIHVLNNGELERFQVKVERLVGPWSSDDAYPAPWREYEGEGKREPWQSLATGDQGIADLADIWSAMQQERDPKRLQAMGMNEQHPVRFHSTTHRDLFEDATLSYGAEITCEIAVLREHGEKISGTYLLRLTRNPDAFRGKPGLSFTRVDED